MSAVFDVHDDFYPRNPVRTRPAEGVPCAHTAAAVETLTSTRMREIFR